jgi:hypothetical protein
MKSIESIYLEFFKKTFDKLGLERYDQFDWGGGGWVKFKNTSFRIQLSSDRGLVETDLSPLVGEENFAGIETYDSLLTLEKSPSTLPESEKRKILGTRLDFHDQCKFLVDNSDWIRMALNRHNYGTTLIEIEKVGLAKSSLKINQT